MNDEQKNSPAEQGPADRQPWSPPRLTRIRAGEAELGATPIKPEGGLAFGS